MAYQEFGKNQRAWYTEKAQLEQEKAQLEQEKKAEQEKGVQLLKPEKAKVKKEHVLFLKVKVEKEKVKKEHDIRLKLEREKVKIEKKALKEQLLKVEKEKQEQLLKMVQKMLDKGNSLEIIADLLDVSVLQVQAWMKNYKK